MAFRDSARSFLLLLARLCVAAVFLYTGYRNIGKIDATAGRLAELHYPVPKIMAIVAVLAELGGGLSLAFGAFMRAGCLALILFLLPTTYSFHVPGMLAGDSMQAIQALKNLAMIGGILALSFAGPGGWSWDRRGQGG
ncbi:MAG: DoxX family protein [Deltaproteobacteria bacterium]|nr:DoxX family protein [Deltaproteobacteria bacterium]